LIYFQYCDQYLFFLSVFVVLHALVIIQYLLVFISAVTINYSIINANIYFIYFLPSTAVILCLSILLLYLVCIPVVAGTHFALTCSYSVGTS